MSSSPVLGFTVSVIIPAASEGLILLIHKSLDRSPLLATQESWVVLQGSGEKALLQSSFVAVVSEV